MATLDGQPIPDEMLPELRRLVSESPEEALVIYGELEPKALRGFRPRSPKAPEAVRRHLLDALEGDAPLDPRSLIAFAAATGPLSVLGSLSRSALMLYFPALAARHGRLRATAALLVCASPEGRALARELCAAPARDNPVPDDVVARSLDHLACVTGELQALLREESDAGQEPWDEYAEEDEEAAEDEGPWFGPVLGEDERRRMEARCEKLEREVRELRQHRRNEKTLRHKNEQLTKKNEELRRELRQGAQAADHAQGEAERARADRARLEAEIDAMKAAIDLQVRDGVARELRSVFNRWLARAERTREEAARPAGGNADVLAQAREALERQRRQDEHLGNRRTIADHLEALRRARREVLDAQANALRPLPELAGVERSLGAEIERLAGLLGEESPAADGDSVAGRLMARINGAATGDDLNAAGALLAEVERMDLLPTAALARLYERYHDRMFRLYAAFTPGVQRARYAPDDPVWSLAHAVEHDEPIVVAMDGHNILHRLPEMFETAYDEQGVPRGEARAKLMRAVVAIFGRAQQPRMDVFFDSPERSERQHLPNVREIYSGGGSEAEHRADEAILAHLEFCCRQMSAVPRLVVTDDAGLRQSAAALGARVLSVSQFGAFLRQME